MASGHVNFNRERLRLNQAQYVLCEGVGRRRGILKGEIDMQRVTQPTSKDRLLALTWNWYYIKVQQEIEVGIPVCLL